MCGIAGWYARGAAAVPPETVAAQCAAIRHRGPDDDGVLTDGNFGFGMRRLSIVDIGGGHQPIETPDGRLAIVFNGEVYNHPALRAELAALGHPFRTHSDTETVLAAYRQWGADAWRRLDGMFAVAIWDRIGRRLTLARDPLGIKPLYYTLQNGGLAFGSELKALYPLPGHRFDTDPRAVHDFFTFGHVRADRSIHAQVRTLPPGSFLTIDATGEPRIERFAQPGYRRAPAMSESDWIEAFRSEWLATVERHLLADVEVGAFLSGGIDSSAVVAAMTRITGAPVKTFTVGFPIASYDESPVAAEIARHLGCEHTTRILEPGRARDILPRLRHVYDEPFADASAIPTWYVSRIAREQVKVVLSGDGGDELFMGYRRHLTERAIGGLPTMVRRGARGVMALPRTPYRTLNRRLDRWQKAVGTAGLPDGVSRFFAKTQITSQAMRARILSPDLLAAFEGERLFERLRDEYFPDPERTISADSVEQFAYADLMLNLQGAMLTKVDRASMANALEVRVPMLSPGFVQWAMGVPRDMKIKGNVGKHLVREAIRPWLPEGVVERRKQGFRIPLAEWFDGDFGRYAEELWRDAGVAGQGYLDAGEVDAVFREHREGRHDHGRFLYALSMFSLWSADRGSAPSLAPTPAVTPRTTAIGRREPIPASGRHGADGARRHAPAPRHRPGRIGIVARPRRLVAGAGRAALLLPAILGGWLLHDLAEPAPTVAAPAPFVDQAARSLDVLLIRDAMRSQFNTRDYDIDDIRRATLLVMPRLPAGWRPLDVQIFPADTGPSVQLLVETAGGERFAFVGMRIDTDAGAKPVLAHRPGARIVYWENGSMAYALVGKASADRLMTLAALMT